MTLSTIHRVKGMEWDRVAVFGVTAGMLPHRLADDDEEERRVLHVALTRCRHQVVILADAGPPVAVSGRAGRAPSEPRRCAAAGDRWRAAGPPGGDASPDGIRPAGDGADGGRRVDRAGGRRPTAGVDRRQVDPALEQALRAWRTERSRQDSVPPFIVLHDRTLLAVAAARPASLVALRQVDGIGPTKLELYGEEIVAVVTSLVDTG